MPIRLENTWSGVVVSYDLPEDLAPPKASYAHKDAKAEAERLAGRRKRLLDTLAKSQRWKSTDKPVTQASDRQVHNSQKEKDRREIEAQLRVEYEQKLENERARLAAATPTPAPDPGEAPAPAADGEPTVAQVRAWAKDQGLTVPPRGKLPDEVVAAFKQAKVEADGE